MATRSKYGAAEERQMWAFIYQQLRDGNEDALKPKGNKIWVQFERTGLTNKSVLSLTTHFRRHMFDKVEDAALPVHNILFIAHHLRLNIGFEQKRTLERKYNVNITLNALRIVDSYLKEGRRITFEELPSVRESDTSGEDEDEEEEDTEEPKDPTETRSKLDRAPIPVQRGGITGPSKPVQSKPVADTRAEGNAAPSKTKTQQVVDFDGALSSVPGPSGVQPLAVKRKAPPGETDAPAVPVFRAEDRDRGAASLMEQQRAKKDMSDGLRASGRESRGTGPSAGTRSAGLAAMKERSRKPGSSTASKQHAATSSGKESRWDFNRDFSPELEDPFSRFVPPQTSTPTRPAVLCTQRDPRIVRAPYQPMAKKTCRQEVNTVVVSSPSAKKKVTDNVDATRSTLQTTVEPEIDTNSGERVADSLAQQTNTDKQHDEAESQEKSPADSIELSNSPLRARDTQGWLGDDESSLDSDANRKRREAAKKWVLPEQLNVPKPSGEVVGDPKPSGEHGGDPKPSNEDVGVPKPSDEGVGVPKRSAVVVTSEVVRDPAESEAATKVAKEVSTSNEPGRVESSQETYVTTRDLSTISSSFKNSQRQGAGVTLMDDSFSPEIGVSTHFGCSDFEDAQRRDFPDSEGKQAVEEQPNGSEALDETIHASDQQRASGDDETIRDSELQVVTTEDEVAGPDLGDTQKMNLVINEEFQKSSEVVGNLRGIERSRAELFLERCRNEAKEQKKSLYDVLSRHASSSKEE